MAQSTLQEKAQFKKTKKTKKKKQNDIIENKMKYVNSENIEHFCLFLTFRDRKKPRGKMQKQSSYH